MSETVETGEFTRIESTFVRLRNVLLLRGQFTPLFTGYYLHLARHELAYQEALDSQLKDLLAAFTLHLVARPWSESIAWTINLRAPRVNFFTTGSSVSENIIGRLFTENVREPDRDLFYSQNIGGPERESHTSSIELDGRDALGWVEQYYARSEQLPARLFRLPDENFAMVVAQPDFDAPWFASLDAGDVADIRVSEETKLLEARRFRFHCGCSVEKILPVLASWRSRLDELFRGEEHIAIQCPRCAARYLITRAMLE